MFLVPVGMDLFKFTWILIWFPRIMDFITFKPSYKKIFVGFEFHFSRWSIIFYIKNIMIFQRAISTGSNAEESWTKVCSVICSYIACSAQLCLTAPPSFFLCIYDPHIQSCTLSHHDSLIVFHCMSPCKLKPFTSSSISSSTHDVLFCCRYS